MPRTFIGWPLPEAARLRIEASTAGLRRRLPRASWTRPETYHLTFAFLGETEEETILQLGDKLVETFRTASPATASIGAAGFFPSDRRPRIGWLGLQYPEEVEHLASIVRRVLAEENVEFDEKPFRPHVTIVRPKARWRRRDAETLVHALEPLQGDPLLVDSITLFESRLDSRGARHVPRVIADCGA
ncbi:MAG: RNA 2',3'-cyclic phosphodiesterase [Thermoanaerobaculia bacterium]|nr:RNA 2',3'-cyclic phosphodiesterase [Thermoanaerobaculia bacterium]